MTHTLHLIEQKELNDQSVAFKFRCCDDSTTDSYCTLSLALAAFEMEETLLHHKTKMAKNHEQKLLFRNGKHPAIQAALNSEITL